MAIEYSVLASGSRGNCLWVRGGGVEILIDCGVSARVIGRRLADVGRDLREVRAVFCTHSHLDHVAGAAVLGRKQGINIYGTTPTLRRIPGEPPQERLRRLEAGRPVAIGGLTVHSGPTRHDAPGSVAFVVSDGRSRLGYVTDLGRATRPLARLLGRADELVLESNHDPIMLRDGPYPARLKRRIRSDVGHLSNAQSAELLAAVCHPGLRRVTLAHLSETNNDPGLARETAQRALDEVGARVDVRVAEQDVPTEPIVLAADARPLAAMRGQLAMPW